MKPVSAAIIVVIVAIASLLAAFSIDRLNFAASTEAMKVDISAFNVSSISINDPNGYVNVESWNGSEIRVSYASTYSLIGPPSPAIKVNGGALNINAQSVFADLGLYTVNIQVLLPAKLDPSITVTSTDGSVTVSVPISGEVNIKTTNGNIETNTSSASLISLTTTNGNIELHASNINNVYASTVNGQVLADINGPLFGNYIFNDVNGNINVFVQPNVSVRFALAYTNVGAVSGLNYTYSSTSNNKITGLVGNGAAYLSESTVNGNAILIAKN